MLSRKEDEKNERIIRGLLKLPDNRRCINCNNVGTQYVCTNFWTFVCTTCSGIHREFTHRVKSISMSKFTSQEVAALQEGGNKRAREIFFKDWDSQRHPDSSNVQRLRDFIKNVYVKRRFSGETNVDRPPRVKMGEKEDLSEHRRTDMSQGGSRSPPFSEKTSPGGRSDDRNYRYDYDKKGTGYEQDRKSPARPQIVTDWRREDRFGNARRASDGDARSADTSSPRPTRDNLGKNVLPPCISEPPKPSSSRSGDGSVHTQRSASSSSLGSTSGNTAEVKWGNAKSLINFDANPVSPTATVTSAPQRNISQLVAQPQVPSYDSNWASFDFPPVTQSPFSIAPLDSVLSELSFQASAPSHPSGVPDGTSAPAVVPMSNITMSSSADLTAASPSGNYLTVFTGGAWVNRHGATPGPPPGQWPSMQHQQPSFNTITTKPCQAAPVRDMGAKVQGHLSASAMQAPQAVPSSVQDVTSGFGPHPSLEVKSSGRNELPQDLFTETYPSYHAPFQDWQTVPPQGMGYMMQYNTAMPMQTRHQSSRSINPFDVADEPSLVQTPAFPSMTPLRGALPNVPQQPGLFPMSSFGIPSSALLNTQTPYYMSGMRPATQSFFPAVPPGPYNLRHQPPSNTLLSSHQQGSIGSEGSAFSTLNTDQLLGREFPQPGPSNPHPYSGVNPFG